VRTTKNCQKTHRCSSPNESTMVAMEGCWHRYGQRKQHLRQAPYSTACSTCMRTETNSKLLLCLQSDTYFSYAFRCASCDTPLIDLRLPVVPIVYFE